MILFLELFEKYKRSQNVALVCGENSLTYEQLYSRCIALASNLRSRGVGLSSTIPDEYDILDPKSVEHSPWVIIISDRSVNAMIGIIAAWMAGGAFVLVAADTPHTVIGDIIEDTAVAVMLKNEEDFTAKEVPEDFQIKFPLKNEIACALFTSGSTGKPKGVILEHRTFNEMLEWQTGYMKPAGWTATASYAAFGFTAVLTELFLPLVNGLTLHILKEDIRHDLFKIIEYIETNNIAYLFMPPNVAEVFTQIYKGKALKYLRIASGRLKSCGKPTGYEILYHLGMSENTGGVTFKSINEAMSGDIPIGMPWHNTKVRLDENTGEIIVSGPSLFRGYLSRPEETAKRLRNGEFYSGDLGRINEEGEFFHIGRMDWDVKIRSMKVNLAQVELAIGECPGVSECAVTTQDDALIAWIVGDISNLREQLSKHLQEHMIPSIFVKSEELPRGRTGKVDRKKLVYIPPVGDAPRDVEITGSQLNYIPPVGDAPPRVPSSGLQSIVTLFERVLGCPVGEDDGFLELGGNSLQFMRLQAEIAMEFSRDIPQSVLYENPTPRMLSKVLSKHAEYVVASAPLASTRKMYPLTGPMRQMWLLWRTGQDNGKYTVSIDCRVTGEIDKNRAKACFEELASRNAILRSRFTERGGNVFQIIEDAVEILYTENPRMLFDLSTAPLFDITLSDNQWSLTTHHIIMDAIGRRMFAEDFWTLYSGGELQDSAQVHEIAIREAEYKPDEVYWLDIFSDGVPRLDLPYDFDRPARITSVQKESVFFDLEETKTLRRFAKEHNATLFRLFLAAYALLLSRLSGSGSVMIGVPISGRRNPEDRRTVGNLIRTLPIRLDVSGMNLETALPHACKRLAVLMENQDISIDQLAKLIKPRRHMGRSPFYDVMINQRPLLAPMPDACGLHPEIVRKDYPGAIVDLVLDVIEDETGVTAVFNYADELFLPETVWDWACMLKNMLMEIKGKKIE